MGLFKKIFGQKPSTKTEDKHLPAYWEDDYCQIEIVARKNVEHILNSIEQIEEFSESTRTEHGFTDIFIRDRLPFPTLNEKLGIEYFEKLLDEIGFEKATQIQYDGYSIINCSRTTTNAFSLPCFNLFYDCNDEFISNIWISGFLILSTEHFNKILETLYLLGRDCDLVLINWNRFELVDLNNKKQIEEYLMTFWK